MIILSFRIWNPSSRERSLLSYFKTWDLPECISPQQTVWDTPKYFPHVVRFELKIAVTLSLIEEKWRANFDSRLRISIEEACGAFENQLRENSFDGGIDFLRLIAHLKSKSILPIVIQNHFQNQLPWVNLLRAVGRGRFYWRCNHLNHWGNEVEQ